LKKSLRIILKASGFNANEATALIKRGSIHDKLGWMFRTFASRRFPRALGSRLKLVFDIRNAIVHYKGEPGHPDERDDSYSKLETQMTQLRRMSIKRDFHLLEIAFNEAICEVDPDRLLAWELTHAILEWRRSR
jgi:hypothetical protein